jgi:type II secretory pathway pseudopilin PulG
MQERRGMTKQTRLSLIEVITIAAVLAAGSVTVVPRFTRASQASMTDELIDGLQRMRCQLTLYRVQHGDRLPPTDSLETFETALTTKVGEHGPYIKRIPVNPYNRLSTVRFDGEPAGVNKAGWRLDTKTGSFQADNNASFAAL